VLSTRSTDSESTDAFEPGTAIGRFRVLAKLGSGGMGVVFAAYDPKLDRKVAIKVLRHRRNAPTSAEARRIEIEAQAMARLAHPNVVTVYEIDQSGDRPFVAMELIDGSTLRRWLNERPRPWREIVKMFVAAGQGLAAAHAAGLVHRDFKPDNVLIGQDGRPRVSDFGLVRTLVSDDASSSELARSDGELAAHVRGSGTPGYMSPEQWTGQPLDARSDQFSFCVALYAAIARHPPFIGIRHESVAEAVMAGRLRPAAFAAVPRSVMRVLRRGLAMRPDDRYPSMDALLAELARDPWHRHWRAAAVAGAVLAAGAAALVPRGGDSRLLCRGAERKWSGVWDPPRASAVDQAFVATHKPYADAAFRVVRRELDAYRAGWITMHTEACEATRVRGEQSDDLLDRRMLCLDARLRDAHALVDRFGHADADVVEHAPVAAGELGDLAACADLQTLAGVVPPPTDRTTRARVAELRGELAGLKAEHPMGHARDRIAALVAATATTRYLPLQAEALLEQGTIAMAGGDMAEASRAYEQAIWAAEAGRDDDIAARAWTALMNVRRAQARPQDALAIAPRVTALLQRIGGNPELEGELHVASAAVLSAMNRLDDAQPEAAAALAILERRFGADDLHVTHALDELATVAQMAGRNDDALAHYRRELAILRAVYGDEHPEVARVLVDTSFSHAMKGHYQDALDVLAKAEKIYERTVGANHPGLARVAYELGLNYAALSQFDKALVELRRAVAIGAVAHGKDHPNYASFQMKLGDTLEALGRHDEALAALREALAIFERQLGPDHVRLASCLEYIARVQVDLGHLREAHQTITRAVAMLDRLYGVNSTNQRSALLTLGAIEIKLGTPARALAPLERAYALGADTDPAVYAEIEWQLGRALVDTGRDAARGMRLVRAARTEFEHDARTGDDLRELQAWSRRR